MLKKTFESPLDFKEIRPVNSNDYSSEAPIHWPPDVKSQLIQNDPDSGKDRRWEEKGMTVDEMVGWHH